LNVSVYRTRQKHPSPKINANSKINENATKSNTPKHIIYSTVLLRVSFICPSYRIRFVYVNNTLTLQRGVDFWWCCFHTVCERKSWHFEPGHVFYGLKAWKKKQSEKTTTRVLNSKSRPGVSIANTVTIHRE